MSDQNPDHKPGHKSDQTDSPGTHHINPDAQEFLHNMSEVAAISARIWQQFLAHQGGEMQGDPDPMGAIPTFQELIRALWDDPQMLARATLDYWQAQQALWTHMTLKWLGGDSAADAVEMPDLPRGGKRFDHEQWSQNALFEYLKQSYLLTSGWMQNLVTEAEGLSPKERKKAAFYTRNYVEAMNPANFFALNPEVLQATASEKGANLVRGLNMMLEDLERGKGQLLIRQTDMDAFEVGRNMAVTPGKVIWQNNVLQLIQYAPTTPKVHKRPLLFIPPWINKYYVLDLNPRKSLMKWLVAQGHTVFMISWVNPDQAQRDETWDSYMQAASDAINVVIAETGADKVHLGSYCIGGTLTGCLLARMGKTGDERVASATFFTAQLDFEDAGELQIFVDDKTIRAMDAHLDEGYLPAEAMASAFNMLRANDLIWSYVVSNYMLGKDPFPFDLLYWNSDSTAMPAKVHQFYLERFYCHNALAQGKLEVQGTDVSLADIRLPVYHVATREDHIAPAASVYAGARMMTGAKVRFVLAGSGHIAGVVNPPEAGKYQYWTSRSTRAETLADWIENATETGGSWWPDWDKWLARQSGGKVDARAPGAKLGVIEDAPGRFVRVRFDQR